MDGKTLITGASGFVGSALSEKLNDSNLILLTKGDGEEKNGVLDTNIGKIFKGVDTVVHLAAIGNYSNATLEDFMRINCSGTINLLEASRKNKVKKFIFASTGLVYGKPLSSPINENHPIQPISPYATSKAIAEINCNLYSKFFDVVVFRFSNVYGNKNTRSVVYKFLDNLANRRTSKISGGEQKRDFVHIDDVVELISKCVDKQGSGTFNVCSGRSYTVNEVYRMAEKTSGIKSKPVRIESEDYSYEFSCANANKFLGFKPTIDLERGMKMIWESLK